MFEPEHISDVLERVMGAIGPQRAAPISAGRARAQRMQLQKMLQEAENGRLSPMERKCERCGFLLNVMRFECSYCGEVG